MPWALLSALWAHPSFFQPHHLVGTSLICPSLHPSDWAYHWAACSDATPFKLCGGLIPTFPLDQQPYPQAAGQYMEINYPGSDGQLQATGVIRAGRSKPRCKPWADVADSTPNFQDMVVYPSPGWQ